MSAVAERTMTNEPIEVRPLSPVIGAEVSGVDLSQPLDPQRRAEIHDALMRHLVIFFRDQDITLEQHMAFGRLFGDLHVHPAAPPLAGHREIFVVHADADSKFTAGEDWHSDVSCDVEPPMGSILQLHEVPEPGGDTLFANMYAAFEALSDQMQSFLSGLTAVHGSEHAYRHRYGDATLRDSGYPTAEHPMVRTHPVTGRKVLYVNQVFTTRIKDMKPKESAALLAFLYDHVTTPEFHCRFHWRPKSMAFWDNRCTQHHALWDYYPRVRHGYRVTVKGDRPY